MKKKIKKYPEGYWMNVGIALGIISGALLGIFITDVLIGIAIGFVIGIPLGNSFEKHHKSKIRSLSTKEKNTMRLLAKIIAVLLLIMFVFGFFVFFSAYMK